MTVTELVQQVRNAPESVESDQVMQVINRHYRYTPTRFTSGTVVNEPGENEGSCKILAFALLNSLSEMETLALFGRYYREDVMGNPAGEDHPNIRNFLLDGWLGVKFDSMPLEPVAQDS